MDIKDKILCNASGRLETSLNDSTCITAKEAKKAMEDYATEVVKNLTIPDFSNSICPYCKSITVMTDKYGLICINPDCRANKILSCKHNEIAKIWEMAKKHTLLEIGEICKGDDILEKEDIIDFETFFNRYYR